MNDIFPKLSRMEQLHYPPLNTRTVTVILAKYYALEQAHEMKIYLFLAWVSGEKGMSIDSCYSVEDICLCIEQYANFFYKIPTIK